jgi:hypothetical protein
MAKKRPISGNRVDPFQPCSTRRVGAGRGGLGWHREGIGSEAQAGRPRSEVFRGGAPVGGPRLVSAGLSSEERQRLATGLRGFRYAAGLSQDGLAARSGAS